MFSKTAEKPSKKVKSALLSTTVISTFHRNALLAISAKNDFTPRRSPRKQSSDQLWLCVAKTDPSKKTSFADTLGLKIGQIVISLQDGKQTSLRDFLGKVQAINCNGQVKYYLPRKYPNSTDPPPQESDIVLNDRCGLRNGLTVRVRSHRI
ncbi:unnamed protein product [Didymodactylos carnosus]|uniref:Uncharacterized protein n=1 Tax=Didymodactylos carnosus TaxID=1234261 RepID=A0A816BN67_9BILA|nr:unnamed protein product [Didymodactylos carnosus]CAF1612692.1 unnamed protein product [Didymodactylos carnosus]CAF4378572.1 unnamed protein product [Didymodactylos carnosus]CAF4496921.1 unnamed protein product [Didymodactylos carnosus]